MLIYRVKRKFRTECDVCALFSETATDKNRQNGRNTNIYDETFLHEKSYDVYVPLLDEWVELREGEGVWLGVWSP